MAVSNKPMGMAVSKDTWGWLSIRTHGDDCLSGHMGMAVSKKPMRMADCIVRRHRVDCIWGWISIRKLEDGCL